MMIQRAQKPNLLYMWMMQLISPLNIIKITSQKSSSDLYKFSILGKLLEDENDQAIRFIKKDNS